MQFYLALKKIHFSYMYVLIITLNLKNNCYPKKIWSRWFLPFLWKKKQDFLCSIWFPEFIVLLLSKGNWYMQMIWIIICYFFLKKKIPPHWSRWFDGVFPISVEKKKSIYFYVCFTMFFFYFFRQKRKENYFDIFCSLKKKEPLCFCTRE